MKTLKSLMTSAAVALTALALVTGCKSNTMSSNKPTHAVTSNKIVTPGAGMIVKTDEEINADGQRQVTELKRTLTPEERSVLLEPAGAETPVNSANKPAAR